MLSRSIFLLGITATAFTTSSCYWLYPYQEPVAPPPNGPTQPQTLDQLKEQQREEQESALEEGERIQEDIGDPEPEPEPLPAPKPAERSSIPVAKAVPGREGFVFSPFNNKMIDVKGFPSGTTVADPSYPKEAKKYFKVP